MLRDESVIEAGPWQSHGDHVADRCARVHHKLKRIVSARGKLDAEEAATLREAQALGLWRRYGYASLVEYMEREMGYSPRAALDRLRVAKAIEELPQIADALTTGELSFSAAREITRVATPDTEQAWIAATEDKNLRQVEELVSGHKLGDTPDDLPDPKLVTKRLAYDVPLAVYALEREARKYLEKQLGQRLDDGAFLEAVFRIALEGTIEKADHCRMAEVASSNAAGVTWSNSNPGDATSSSNPGDATSNSNRGDATSNSNRVDHARAPNEGACSSRIDHGRAPYQIGYIVCTECKRGWQDGGGVTVEVAPPVIERALCDAQELGSLDAESPERAKQTIPPAVRRLVMRRDHARCRVPDCRCHRNLDVHHIVPRAEGGSNKPDNLLVLCEAHHLAHHEGSLRIEGTPANTTFVRSPNNRFKIETHVVETTKALVTLGWKRHEVKAAIDATRAHVGRADLPLEEWIKIALSKCPRPS